MTITTDDTRSILTCSDHVRADTQQAWDLTIGDDPAGITVAEFTGDDAEDGVAGPRGRVAAQGTGANAAMLGVGGGMLALGGLARWAARRDPAGWVERRVSIQGDDEETRRRKSLFTLALILVIPFSVVWAALYFVYGEPLSALASMSYAVVTIAGMVLLFRFRNFALFCWTELALAFPVPVAQQLLLGGFVGSSAVILWSFLAALLAVMFVGAREAWWWFGAFVVAVVACSVLQPYVRVQNHLPTWLISAFFVLNIISVCAVSLVFLYSFARDRRKLRELEVSYLNQEMMLRQADKLATLRLELLPFSEQALRHFLFLERPEGMDLNDAEGLAAIEHAVPVTGEEEIAPHLQEFRTVGHLYRSIEAGFRHLAEKIGEENLFLGPSASQTRGELFGWKELAPISNAAEAVRAIEAIVEQGEGPRGDWRNAHFGRFLSVLGEYLQMREDAPGLEVTRPVLPVLVRLPETGGEVNLITDPATARVADLCNVTYEVLLHLLYRLMSHIDESAEQIGTLATVAVGIMNDVIGPLADILSTMPVGPEHPGRTAGATFELFYQPDYLLPHRKAAWLVGAELLTGAAARAESEMRRDHRLEPVVSALRSYAEALRQDAS